MNIKEAREMAGMTRVNVAKMLGYPEKKIQDWEEGNAVIAPFIEKRIVEELLRIARKHDNI